MGKKIYIYICWKLRNPYHNVSINRLFDDASTKLNMASLVSFLAELCAASQAQLFSRMTPQTPKKGLMKWPRKVTESVGYNISLISRTTKFP